MKNMINANQLWEPPQADERFVELRVWMVRNGESFPQIGKALGGLTGVRARSLLMADRISVDRHKKLVAYGIPTHLLPLAVDVPRGRPRKEMQVCQPV